MSEDSSTHQLHPESWVDRYANYLYNYAVIRVSDPEVARDLVQEAFLAGLNSAKNFKGTASERTWLIAILKRKVIDHYRKINSKKGKAEVRLQHIQSDDIEGDWLEERAADPLSLKENSALENEELGLAIEECISKLPPKQAKVFSMKTLQGMGTEEVCNELGINPSNLWVMIHRARTSLMACLDKNWFGI